MKTKTFDVACFSHKTGRLLWSGTWEATSPAAAIAEACLAPDDRPQFILETDYSNLDELTVDHPAHDMAEAFSVTAQVIK